MLLAVDIGNTNINFAAINKKGKIVSRYSTPANSACQTKPLFRLPGEIGSGCVDKVIVASVVPKMLKKVRSVLKKRFRKAKIFTVGENIKVPLKCIYNKKQIGQDRLITAFAAASLYGLPILIIDFGTAVTFDVVSRGKVYLGGLILPGVKMSLESLSERTAMLPKTYLKKTRSFIGKDTVSSIRGGMTYGYAALCEGLIRLFRKKINKNIKVIATGGDAPLIAKHAPSVKNIDLELSLKGLYLLSKKI